MEAWGCLFFHGWFVLRFDLAQNLQRLIFKGKQLHNDHNLFDYGVNMNDVIQVWKKAPLADQTNYEAKADTEKAENSAAEKEEPKNSNKIVEEEAESELFKVGDIVDILDTDEGAETAGGWFEGSIAKITREEGDTVVAGCDGLTY